MIHTSEKYRTLIRLLVDRVQPLVPLLVQYTQDTMQNEIIVRTHTHKIILSVSELNNDKGEL